jgi:hypothetical protein
MIIRKSIIFQKSEPKTHFRCLPSEGIFQTALLGGQSAQRIIVGVVHFSENIVFLEMTYKIFVFTAYQLRRVCILTIE